MIARIWRGRTRSQQATSYEAYVRETGVAAQTATPGNRGSLVFTRRDGEETEFLVLSLWESMDAVREFAGDPPEVAVYYPEDERYLLEFEPEVRHYAVSTYQL